MSERKRRLRELRLQSNVTLTEIVALTKLHPTQVLLVDGGGYVRPEIAALVVRAFGVLSHDESLRLDQIQFYPSNY